MHSERCALIYNKLACLAVIGGEKAEKGMQVHTTFGFPLSMSLVLPSPEPFVCICMVECFWKILVPRCESSSSCLGKTPLEYMPSTAQMTAIDSILQQ